MSSQRTRIKICGLSRDEDIDVAAEAGADAVGFVFYPKSPRLVTIDQAARLAQRLPPFITPVALFVNAEASQIDAVCAAIPNLLLQFHGDESPAECSRYRRPYLRAARVTAGFDLLDFASRYPDASGLLLDAFVDGFGGGGKVFDWSLVPPGAHHQLVLSGGLTRANVTDGIAQVRPWAVDVSSGVESARGIKSAELIRRFCQAVRAADASLAATAAT